MPEPKLNETILKGINASPGICIGKAYIVDKEGVEVVEKYYIPGKKSRQSEIKRFKAAVKKAKDELRSIIESSPEEFQHAHILETHMALLKDKSLYGKTLKTIENEKVNAEWALKTVVSDLKAIFQTMTDSYIKERASDIVHVSDRVMHNLVGTKTENIAEIDKRVILVAQDLSPAETSQINLERIKGFITDRGGKASHTGIIARALEIPAVVGLEKATVAIKSEDLIIVDGNSGIVIIHPSEQTLVEYEERKIEYEEYNRIRRIQGGHYQRKSRRCRHPGRLPAGGHGQHRAARRNRIRSQLRRRWYRPVSHRISLHESARISGRRRAF
jgi:phosphotransferase system enzyme I (PtsI)